MGIKFKDKNTGFVVEFTQTVDIETTRQHPDYEEILEEITPVLEQPKRKYTVKQPNKE